MKNSNANKLIFDAVSTYSECMPELSVALLESNKFNMGSYDGIPKLNNMDDVIPYLEHCPKIFNLPFDNCTFSFDESMILNARYTEDGYIETHILIFEEDNIIENPAIALHDFSGKRFSYRAFRNAKDETAREQIGFHVCALASCLAIINSENVTTVENISEASKFKTTFPNGYLSKKHFVYRTLHITPDVTPKKIGVTDKATNSKHVRLHLRRGHLRRLKNKVIWVQPTVVGSNEIGEVVKNYQVKTKRK